MARALPITLYFKFENLTRYEKGCPFCESDDFVWTIFVDNFSVDSATTFRRLLIDFSSISRRFFIVEFDKNSTENLKSSRTPRGI